MVVATVLPPLVRSARVDTIRPAMVESRLEVGSSRNSRLGLMSISWLMHTRLRSPPDTPRTKGLPMMLSRHAVRPSSSMTASAFLALPREGPREAEERGEDEGLRDGE
ncbi:unnamed protein product [Musa textilis]